MVNRKSAFLFLIPFMVFLLSASPESKNPNPSKTQTRTNRAPGFIKIENIAIENNNNFPKPLREKLLKIITRNNIESLLKKRYSFFLSETYHSLQFIKRERPEIKITITRANPYAKTYSFPILYATITLRTPLPNSTTLKSKISVSEKSYRAILPGITGEIAFMLARLNKFQVNTKILSPILENYTTTTQLRDIFETLKRYISKKPQPTPPIKNGIEIYSIAPYTLKEINNKEPIRGITLLTNMGFISLDSNLKPNKITMRDLAFQQSSRQFHQGINQDFDTVFTTSFNSIYLFSNYNGKLKEIDFDKNTVIEKRILFHQNSTLLKWGNNTFLLIKEPPNPGVIIFSPCQSAQKLKKTLSISLYTNFFSAASIKQNIFPQNSLLYIFDTLERRIRIIDSRGNEIDSIKPIYDPQHMPMPNNMKIFSDGSFILSGSGTIMKFDQSGLPLWEIKGYRIKYPTSFPPLTKICVIEERESIYILDNLTNTILKYSYNQEKISKIKKPTRANSKLTPVKIANLFEKLAREKEEELIYPAARNYYNYAISIYRKLRLQYPLQTNYSSCLLKLIRERNRIVNALVKRNILNIKLEAEYIYLAKPETTLALEITNKRDTSVTNIRIKINIPYLAQTPAEITIQQLEGNQKKTISIPLRLERNLSGLLSNKLLVMNNLERKNWDVYIRVNYTFRKTSTETIFHFPVSLSNPALKN